MTKKKAAPLSGDITIKRKLDKIQLIREPDVVLATLTAEDALLLAENMEKSASKILQATAAED